MRRREFIAGSAAGAAFLAGCTGTATEETPTDQESTDVGDGDGGTAATETATSDPTYSVSMAPVGEVTFDAVPENVANYFPGYADMVVALGHGDALNSVGVKGRYYTTYYDELEGVSVDKESLTELVTKNGIDKEAFYELGSDLHLIDPEWLVNNGFFGFEQSDIEELSGSVAPFLGNTIFRRTDGWHDYRYYSLYEAFEKMAQVFREEERYRQFKSLHDGVLADVSAKLPAADERPNALLCFAASDEPDAFSPYRLTDKGTNKEQFRDLGISDALSGTGIEGLSTSDRGKIDYETMLEVDPDSLLVRGHETKSRAEFEDTVLAYMEGHDTASELAAVEESRVYRGGPIYVGPIHHLFLLERYATLYFPDTYSGELFDRAELAAIVRGEA